MATISITTANDRTSNYSPSPGDDFVLSDLASLIVDNSTVSVDIEFNSRFQEITLENTSTTQPNIVNIDAGGLNGQNGAIVLDGLLISIGTADGTASQTIQFPADANGAYPSFVGYCYIDSVIYTQISSFTGIRNDFRGRHFTYDNVTGVMTFGDGTNGDMPTGDVQVENIYVELGGSAVNISDGFIRGNGHCVFVDGNFWSNPNITVQSSWGIINNSSKFQPYQFFKHKYSAMNYIGVGSGENARMTLAEDTVGDTITFQTESTSSTEVVENFNVPMWGIHELRFVEQKTSTFSRTRLYNNGGSATLKIMQGYGTVFTPYGGTDGNWVIEWSDGYKTTDLSPHRVHHGRYEDAKQNILYRLIGSTSWSGERGGMTLFDIDAGEYVIGSGSEQMVIPSDVAVDEIVNTSGGGKLTLNNILFEGQASSGTRDFNLNSPAGTLIANFEAPNDTSHGNQSEPNASFRFASFIGNDPSFSSGMNHSIITKDAARTLGQIWFMPHAISPNGEVLAGSFDGLLYGSDRLYITQVGTKAATQSDVISGCGIVTALTIKGWLTSEFAFEYKLWEVGDTEPSSYQTLTLVNVQASQAGYTTATKWNFKYTVEKISGAANSGYIQGIYFDCPADPLFKWEPELADITIAFNGGLLAGDYIRIEDDLGVTRSYTQATSSHENIVFPGSDAGSGWRYAVDRKGFTPDVGDLTLIVGATIPVSVSLNPYRFRDGTVMYSLSTNPAVSVSFDLVTPEARITVNDVNASPQDIFNAAENALITEDGMAWHAQQGSVVEWDDIIQGGRQLYLGAGWRLFGIGLNAGVNGIVASTDDQVFAAGSSQMRTGDGYKEYTQADRDRAIEIWQDRGLDSDNPKLIDATTETSGAITKVRDAVNGVITVTRQS